MGLLDQATVAAGTTAEDWSNWSSTFQNIVAGLAIIIGAVWAYFRFFKDRIYRPRVAMALDGGFISTADDTDRRLLCALTLKNIGGSKVRLVKSGTGIKVTTPLPTAPTRAPLSSQRWNTDDEVVFDAFASHEWIESNEAIRDEVLLAPMSVASVVYKLEARIKVKRWARPDIAISTVRIIGHDREWIYENTQS
jgi:hypothetical protein